jgi:hypothetical protein
MNYELDVAVNDIIAQLKQTQTLTAVEPTEDLSKDNLEEFIIKTSGKLITKTLGIVDNVQTYISSAPDAKDVAAFAELLKAASSSMESLNKIYISLEKNKTTKEVKQMDIDSREKTNTQDNAVFLLSRREVMKELFNQSTESDDSNIIEV